jgi:hypothetical protein
MLKKQDEGAMIRNNLDPKTGKPIPGAFKGIVGKYFPSKVPVKSVKVDHNSQRGAMAQALMAAGIDPKTGETIVKKGSDMSISSFWSGFEKRAVENFVSANPAMEVPGAPEKALKWNEMGGVDPRTPEELQQAEAAKMRTLSPTVAGAQCGTCMHFRPLTPALGHGFCTHPDVKQDVTENMHCANWENPESHDPVQAAQEEQQEAELEQAQLAQEQQIQQQSQAAMGGPAAAPGSAPQGMPQQGAQQGAQQAPWHPGQPAGNHEETPESASDAVPTDNNSSSAVGKKSGFPEGPQTSQNPLVEQAVNDFQGQGATASSGGGGGGGPSGSSSPKKKSDSKSSDKKESGSKGHTINIHVGKGEEKTASVDYWAGIVDGY